MGVRQWSAVSLTGEGQAIPRACPNCLKPSAVDYRYSYAGPLYLLNRTSYWQTFYYCSDCDPILAAYFRWASRMGCLGYILIVAAFFGTLAVLAGSVLRKGTALGDAVGADNVVLLTMACSALAGFGMWALLRGCRRLYLNRWPLKPEQALRAPAAYYTGRTFSLTGAGAAIYRAVRPEWIKLLVEANSDSVDDATYQRIVGTGRPVSGGEKPFKG